MILRPVLIRSVVLFALAATTTASASTQDKAAEDAFQKIKESIDKAKTISVRYKFEGVANLQKVSGSGAIFLKEGNRVRVEAAMTSGDQEITSLMVSDGKKTRLRNSMGRMAGPDELDTPADFGVVLKHNLAHSCSSLSGHPSSIKDPLKALSFSEFAGGEGEKGTKTLSYQASDAQASLSMKVWYDPKTFRILKRTMEVKAAQASATITEILEEYSFDAAIPDDRFDTSLPVTAEEKAAEAVFQKIRESLEKAKTVRIKFTTEENMFGESHTFSGTVLLKEGNRARLETKASFRGKEGSSLILSNGKILRGTTSNAAMDLWIPPDVPEQDTPANLGILIRGSLVHSSLSAGGLFKEGLAREGEESKNATTVSEFRDAADEKGIRTLSYKLTDRSGWPTQIRLWYDPATLKLTKRSMIHRSPHSGFAFKETLEEFVLNGEIPDASFILAAGPAPAAVGGLIAETGDAVPDRSLDPLPKGSRARLGSLDLRYDNFVFLPDGKGVASIAVDGTVHFWDHVSGAVTRRFRLPGPGKMLALSPGARRAAWSGEGGRIHLVDLEPGKASLPLEGSSAKEFWPSNVDFSPDGSLLATSSPAKDVLLWDSASGKRLHKLQAPRGTLRFLTFSPDGTLLAAEGPDHAVICWETATAKERGRVAGHGDQMVSSAAFSPDGKTLLTGGHDGRLRIWDVTSGRALFVPDCNPLGTFSPDGKTIITQARNRGLLIWDVATGREVRRVGLGSDNDGVTVFSPDGRFFATRVGGGAVVVFETASAKQLVTLAGSGAAFSRGTATYAFSPDGRLIVMSSGPMPPNDENHRSKVRMWEAASGREIVHAGGHREAVTSVSFAPDGKSLASASRDGSVRLWDVTTGRELLRLEGHGGPVSCVAVSPDGKTLASGTWGEIILWDAVNWRSRAISVPPRGGAEGLAFSPDGKSLFSNRLFVLDVTTGKPVLTFQGQQAPGSAVVAYSPDGRHLVATHMSDRGQDAALRLWDASTGKEAMKIPELAWSKVLALSPEGRTLACFRETIETWDATTWKKRAAFPRPEHGRAVLSMAFSPDAKTLVAGSEDGALMLWDPETGKELRQLQSRGAGVNALAFSPDGKSLAAAMGDSTVLIWNLSSEAARSEIPSRGQIAARAREIDVLQLIDPAKATGDWRLDEGKLISPEQSSQWKFHIFWLPLIPPAEYDVTIVAARRGGTSSLDLGLTVAGIPRSAVLDGWDGICALQSADGLGGPDKETSKLKRLFTDDQPRTVVYSVRRTGVTVTAEGKTVIQWSGDPGWPVGARELYLGSWSPFEVRRMVLTPVSGTATILLNRAGPAVVLPRSQPKPPAVAPADGRPWRAIFDGKTTDFMNPVSAGFWTVQDGALSLTSGSHDSAQTRESFGDGEIRIRFEAKDVPYGAIAVRQGAEGRYVYLIDRTVCAALGAGPHEMVFTCRGEEVKAMLDGKPATVQAEGGRPKAGQIQFGGNSSGLRILAIEYRELSK